MLLNHYVQKVLTAIGILSPLQPGFEANDIALFGGPVPWNTSDVAWLSVDDTVRGGSSVSRLVLVGPYYTVLFSGDLDTSTLGGAGFASQTTKPAGVLSNSTDPIEDNLLWDLSAYDGLRVLVGDTDDKTYTLTVKDDVPAEKRPDGRERSGISWEAAFRPADWPPTDLGHGVKRVITLPWSNFKPTYRGRNRPDTPALRTDHIRRFSFLMRSFFEQQDGFFRLELKGITAFRGPARSPELK